MNTSKTMSAVITGSSSGIGLAIARTFAANGLNVMLNGFGPAEQLEKIKTELKENSGVRIEYHGADMSKPDEIRDMMKSAEETFGSLDIVVNNAGIQHVDEIETFPDEKWDAILAINLSSAFHTIKAAFPNMKKRGFGRIINIASAHGLVASPYKSAYVAAKHGIVGLTKTVALEGAEHGITANAICPGYVKTPLVEAQIPATAKARGITEDEVVRDVLLKAQPTKKFVSAEDIGAMALFLCSSNASSITGAALQIDGGWTAH